MYRIVDINNFFIIILLFALDGTLENLTEEGSKDRSLPWFTLRNNDVKEKQIWGFHDNVNFRTIIYPENLPSLPSLVAKQLSLWDQQYFSQIWKTFKNYSFVWVFKIVITQLLYLSPTHFVKFWNTANDIYLK